jgi:DNA polymerase III epsilon subunit-like protein
MKNNLCIFDVETGGKKSEENPITEIAMQFIDPIKFKAIHTYQTYVRPYANLKIEKAALDYTRVTMKQINEGIDVKEMVKAVIAAVKVANPGGRGQSAPILVGHNVDFDVRFLSTAFTLCGKQLFDFFDPVSMCTMRMMKLMEAGKLKSEDVSRYTLTSCCERVGVKLKAAHGAMNDVNATIPLAKALILRLREGKAEEVSADEEAQPKSRNFFQFANYE